METNDKLKTKAKYYDADPTKDVLCEGCGGKLWDAEKQLLYWFPIFETDYSGIRCVHCSHDYKNPWLWENLPNTFRIGDIDTQYFDDQADSCGMCPPTVFKRYEAALKELPDDWRDLGYEDRHEQAHEVFERVNAEWRLERSK